MLIRQVSKIIIILILTTFFLLFKNNAKELEAKIFQITNNIDFLNQTLIEKKNKYTSRLNKTLKNNNLKYINEEKIIIEKYFNNTMTIIRVDYVKKSN